MTRSLRRRLLASSLMVSATLVAATPGLAQTTPPGDTPVQPGPTAPLPNAAQAEAPADTGPTANPGQDIIVTGSILRRADTETPSPITVVTQQELTRRGISTTQDAVQQLASNNGPALTNSFTANGAFAAGASAVSLRGLSTSSTLVLFDGLRAAYYPLSDDGTRNFVDLNTIPDDIVDSIQVLRDGASSSYGADAIAGVVNIITKRQIKGLTGRAEAGLSDRGDASQYRLSLTGGVGDIDSDGYNAYISGFYYRSESLANRERPYPFSSDDQRRLGNANADAPNNVANGIQSDGSFSLSTTSSNFLVRPYDAATGTVLGRYQTLNPNCGPGTPVNLTAAQLASRGGSTAPATVCQYDFTNLYGVIQPQIERFGGSGRVSAKIGGSEAYVEVNFIQSTSSYFDAPDSIRRNAQTGIFFPRYSSAASGGAFAPGSQALQLPVFVCPERVNCATSPNRQLNPNNPFAAQGQVGQVIGRDYSQPTFRSTRNRSYRAAFGINGDITDHITYDVGGTAMHVDLQNTQAGFVYIQNLLNVIADGTFNFVNPSATPQSVNDYIKPTNITNSSSDQYQIQGTVGFTPIDLPGGPLQIGVGGSIRYEAIDAPSANTDQFGPTQRYFAINAFGTRGNRTVYSAYGEVNAPILRQLEVDASGRYDNYSSGQDYFSPKVGAKFTPVRQVTLRGTYSKGFRIPSFGEANALPTTGFVTNQIGLFNDTYLAQYGCSVATFNSCPSYIRAGSYGLTTLASPNLAPEKSRSFTGGVIVEPIRGISFTVDYYNIKKTGAITSPSTSPALLAYYTGQAIPPQFNVIADAVDPNFPNAQPRIGFVQSQLINSDTIKTQGLDFGANIDRQFGAARFTSNLSLSYILKLETQFPDGTTERYDGTLGNFNLTAGSGTPKWHGFWLNTIDFNDTFALSGTVNLFGGYDLSAQDQGGAYKDGSLNPGFVNDRVKDYYTLDLTGTVKVNDQFSFYVNILNVLDNLPPIDPVTYGANLYNPVQGGTGILGRYIKAGIRFGL